ncbi:MAG: DNA polymerase III subunit gamma and tau, partial [Propionibacteriaceae bacterium]|nr:DNA polymerase III subunit gamma and tau [Propionibacteriaceae bacterium]
MDDDMDERDDDRYDQDGPGLLDALATDQLMPKPSEADPAPAPAAKAPVRRTTKASTAPKPAPARAASPKTATRAVARKTLASAKADPSPDVPEPLALYRRYRPDTFDALIGQEHVTEPLKRALTNNKVHHAYLFSGPRGCGKTSSARILARCLNCEKGPTATPCGVCQSCRDLATGGPGSIDVIEMDAATHGLVDDARDLRERAFFAPVQSRYKVYIIDEAHMVTPQGFNALLKIVEEPPPHVKFIFATTEPDKVIGTIRSRTHHYPFRLVPPKVMQTYLQHVCDEEGVAVEPGVLSLVVRAGAGSVRDSLSVLDQLLGGAGPDGVTYTDTAALLGYTPDALLDEMVDALATGDGAAVYRVIDKVIETGQDARHFGADLLQRLRDVMIVASVPDALTSGLIDVAGDQAERLQSQAKAMGRARLAHAAEVMANGLTAMRGTTSPRLHLELMCSRILIPDQDVSALTERLSKIERQLSTAQSIVPVSQSGARPPQSGFRQNPDAPASVRPDGRPRFEDDTPAPAGPPQQQQRPAPAPAAQAPATQAPPVTRPNPASTAPPQAQSGPPPTSQTFGLPEMKAAWPAVLERVLQARRFAWILLSQNAEPIEMRDDMLTIGFTNPGARDSFLSGSSQQLLAQACAEVT